MQIILAIAFLQKLAIGNRKRILKNIPAKFILEQDERLKFSHDIKQPIRMLKLGAA